MEQLATSGHEWKDAERVQEYVQRQEAERDSEHSNAFQHFLDMLPYPNDAAISFLDLGAGAGAFSAAVLARYPNAHGVLADFSEAMMEQGSAQLAPFAGRYTYVELDMTSESWPEALAGPFQAVVSSRAIHHLTNDQKARVFRHAYQALAPGGFVANWDHIRKPDDQYSPGSLHALTEASEEAQLDILREAGFVNVSCAHLSAKNNGLFTGVKPALDRS